MEFSESDIRLRQLCPADLDKVTEFAVNEGWFLHRNDVDVFYQSYPEGFFVIEVKGRIAGCALGSKLNEDCGCVGAVLVDKQFRGHGLGRRLIEAVNEYLGSKNVGLSSTQEMVTTYAKFGYIVRSWDVVIYEGIPVMDWLEESNENDVHLIPSNKVSFQELNTYDQRIASMDRKSFLRLSLGKENLVSYTAMVGNRVVGYGSVQPSKVGFLIAPLYADTPRIARAILPKLCQNIPEAQKYVLRVKVPDCNREMQKMAMKMGLKEGYRLSRLYTKEDVKLDLNNVYVVGFTDVCLV